MMSERAYTVAEIDRMRDAVEHQWLYGRRMSEPEPEQHKIVNDDGSVWFTGGGSSSRSYNEADKTKCVEEMLRTYMLAGIEPEDLE